MLLKNSLAHILITKMSKSFITPKQVIYICTGSKCKKRGGKEISKLLWGKIKSAGLKDVVEIVRTECTDRCKFAPIMSLQPQNIWLQEVTDAMASHIYQEEILKQISK